MANVLTKIRGQFHEERISFSTNDFGICGHPHSKKVNTFELPTIYKNELIDYTSTCKIENCNTFR